MALRKFKKKTRETMIRTYIINLASSKTRKEYMQRLLSKYEGLQLNFIEAIDGRLMSDSERMSRFDLPESIRRYGKKLNPGEIGCTLSHFKCYHELLKSNEKYALVLEDDISLIREDISDIFSKEVDKLMTEKGPRILLLSGDYWYWKRHKITHVFSAVGGYSYLINTAAANIIVHKAERPYNVADDWDLYKSYGIKLFAIHPYLIDANITDMVSDIKQEYWGNKKSLMSLKNIMLSCYCGLIKRILVLFGHFESKVR